MRGRIAGAGAADYAAQQLFNGQQPLGMNQLEQAQFEMKALLLAVVQVVEGAQHDLQIAGELFFGKEQGGARGAGPLIGWRSGAARSAAPPSLAIRALRR